MNFQSFEIVANRLEKLLNWLVTVYRKHIQIAKLKIILLNCKEAGTAIGVSIVSNYLWTGSPKHSIAKKFLSTKTSWPPPISGMAAVAKSWIKFV
jgi:hypothetical protein